MEESSATRSCRKDPEGARRSAEHEDVVFSSKFMDIMKMLSELRSHWQHIEEAIIALERLARGHGKRHGRPPKWMSEPQASAETSHTEPRKKRTISSEARSKMSEAQRKRWSAKRKAQP